LGELFERKIGPPWGSLTNRKKDLSTVRDLESCFQS